MRPLTMAVPKGRLLGPLAQLLQAAGAVAPDFALDENSRRLSFEEPGGRLKFLLVKPSDVPTYVEYGAADLGVAGKDVLCEAGREVCELVDLRVGYCKMVVAVPEASGIQTLADLPFGPRIATKFPRTAQEFFERRGVQAEIVKLNGSIEIAPLVGLAEAIMDLTATGQTLVENGLVAIADVSEATARLVANRISYKAEYDRIRALAARLAAVVPLAEGDTCSA